MDRDIDKIETSVAELYLTCEGEKAARREGISAAGSDRRYWRLSGSGGRQTIVGAYGPDVAENKSFISLARYFGSKGMNVPRILGESADGHCYLQTDLGDVSLFSQLGSPEIERLCAKTMVELARLQTLPREEWEGLTMHTPFCCRQVMWDLNYFKYEYLKPSAVVYSEEALEDDFEEFATRLLTVPPGECGFMYRDCQSRNVMLLDGEPWWIDFQGGRVGPCIYDAVSFLWQAKAGFSEEFRRRMLAVYASEFSRLRGVSAEDVLSRLDEFVLFRTLQVLGAYGFRGLVERRAHFIESIPGALCNLGALLDSEVFTGLPELARVCRQLVADRRFEKPRTGRLRVEVFSFSYKRGYPADYSGNGGGFMFDCRAMHNPGRYAEYKKLTGRDRSVKEFLEERGEIQPFLQNAWGLVDKAVKRYIDRGFTSLQIGFGCTGGQHRSVYSADATARHLAELFPEAEVVVNHREQGILEELTQHDK